MLRLGDGKSVLTARLCKGVALTLQGVEVLEDFIPMELGCTDVILRVKWLRTLGGTDFNYDSHVMRFKLGNTTITLRGDPSLKRSAISLGCCSGKNWVYGSDQAGGSSYLGSFSDSRSPTRGLTTI